MLHELCKGTSTLAQTLSLSSSNALPSLLLQSLIAWRENSPQGKRAVEIEIERGGREHNMDRSYELEQRH